MGHEVVQYLPEAFDDLWAGSPEAEKADGLPCRVGGLDAVAHPDGVHQGGLDFLGGDARWIAERRGDVTIPAPLVL